MKQDTLLLIADSERDADMLYASGLRISEPFIFVEARGRKFAVVGDADLDRARRDAAVDRVLPLATFRRECAADGEAEPCLGQLAVQVLRHLRVRKVHVPHRFPLGYARQIRASRIKVKVREGWFFPDRQFKTAPELKMISAALTMAEIGLSEGIHALKRARVQRGGKLLLNGNPLSADRLRAIIDCAVFDAGGIPSGTVVACGPQACDPNERGHGLLRAHLPIILDVSPRSQKTGYFGHLARTVVRGTVKEPVHQLYEAVRTGQELAFKGIRSGANCAGLLEMVTAHFALHGFPTARRHGRLNGVLHGVGRGVGLESQEPPGTHGSSRSDRKSVV